MEASGKELRDGTLSRAKIDAAFEAEMLENDTKVGITTGQADAIAANTSKLSTIEDNAKDDQTGAEIKALYEAEANTNAYTDSEKAKLAGLDTRNGAPVQDTSELIDISQASLSDKEKRFVEDEGGDFYYDAQSVGPADADHLAPTDQAGGVGFWVRIATGGAETAASIKTKYESNADTNAFTDAEKTKVANALTSVPDGSVTNVKLATEVEDRIAANAAAAALNTTHRASDGKDHADVVANTAAIAALSITGGQTITPAQPLNIENKAIPTMTLTQNLTVTSFSNLPAGGTVIRVIHGGFTLSIAGKSDWVAVESGAEYHVRILKFSDTVARVSDVNGGVGSTTSSTIVTDAFPDSIIDIEKWTVINPSGGIVPSIVSNQLQWAVAAGATTSLTDRIDTILTNSGRTIFILDFISCTDQTVDRRAMAGIKTATERIYFTVDTTGQMRAYVYENSTFHEQQLGVQAWGKRWMIFDDDGYISYYYQSNGEWIKVGNTDNYDIGADKVGFISCHGEAAKAYTAVFDNFGLYSDFNLNTSGDMNTSVYDPTNEAGDAFLMSNFREGADAKILTTQERTDIAEAKSTLPLKADKDDTIPDGIILRKKAGGNYESSGKTITDIVVQKGALVTGTSLNFANGSTAEDTLSADKIYSSISNLDHGVAWLIITHANFTPSFQSSLGTTVGTFTNYDGKYYVKITNFGTLASPIYFFSDALATSSGGTTPPSDTTPPSFTELSVTNIQTNQGQLSIGINEAGISYWALRLAASAELSKSDILNGTGDALQSGSFNHASSGILQTLITGLTQGTNYAIDAYAEDDESTPNVGNVNTHLFSTTAQSIKLLHFIVIGQSQAIGISGVPKLNTATDANVLMLGDYQNIPISASTLDIQGMLFNTSINETLDRDNVLANGETIAIPFGRDLLNKINDSSYKVCVTISARETTNIQDLTKGGPYGVYEKAIVAIERASQLAASSGWEYEVHHIWYHGGTAGSNYQSALQNHITNFRTDASAYTNQTVTQIRVFADQIRQINDGTTTGGGVVAYSPEPSQALAKAMFATTNAYLTHTRNQVEKAGDLIHLTSNGQRHAAVLMSDVVYKVLFQAQSPQPLKLGTPAYDGDTNEITIPVENVVGTLQGSGNYGIYVYNDSLARVEPISVVLDNVANEITVTLTNPAFGLQNLNIRANYESDIDDYNRYNSANGTSWLIDDTTLGVLYSEYTSNPAPIFNDVNSSSAYRMAKYLIRDNIALQIDKAVFPPTTLSETYIGATSADIVIPAAVSTEHTAYIVAYADQATAEGKSDAQVKTDAQGTGGIWRGIVTNAGNLSAENTTTITTGISENTIYHVRVIVENTVPTVGETYYKTLQSKRRHETLVYFNTQKTYYTGAFVYVPEQYWKRRDLNQEWPLLFSFHGNGERVYASDGATPSTVYGVDYSGVTAAFNFTSLASNYFAGYIESGNEVPEFIVISPQFALPYDTPNMMNQVYDILVSRGMRVNSNGWAVTGLSGGGACGLLLHHQSPKVAAITFSAPFLKEVTEQGGSDRFYDNPKWAFNVPMVNVWGENDGVITPQSQRDYHIATRALSGNLAQTVDIEAIEIPGVGHSGAVWDAHAANTLPAGSTYDNALNATTGGQIAASNVPNASSMVEFFQYHINNTYNYNQRVSDAILIAETTLLVIDKNRAQTILNNSDELTAGEVSAFQARINAVDDINAANTAVTTAESSTTQGDYDSALTLVNALPAGTIKTDLLDRLNVILIGQVNTNSLVTTAEGTGNAGDIAAAQSAIDALSNLGNISGVEVTAKTNAIAAFQARIDAIGGAVPTVWLNFTGRNDGDDTGNINNVYLFYTPNPDISNMIDENGAATSYGVQNLTKWTGERPALGVDGPGTLYPQKTADYAVYATSTQSFDYVGLDPNKTYELRFYGAHDTTNARGSTYRAYNNRGDADDYDSSVNVDDQNSIGMSNSLGDEGVLSGIRPDDNGKIYVQVSVFNSQAVLNAGRIIEE